MYCARTHSQGISRRSVQDRGQTLSICVIKTLSILGPPPKTVILGVSRRYLLLPRLADVQERHISEQALILREPDATSPLLTSATIQLQGRTQDPSALEHRGVTARTYPGCTKTPRPVRAFLTGAVGFGSRPLGISDFCMGLTISPEHVAERTFSGQTPNTFEHSGPRDDDEEHVRQNERCPRYGYNLRENRYSAEHFHDHTVWGPTTAPQGPYGRLPIQVARHPQSSSAYTTAALTHNVQSKWDSGEEGDLTRQSHAPAQREGDVSVHEEQDGYPRPSLSPEQIHFLGQVDEVFAQYQCLTECEQMSVNRVNILVELVQAAHSDCRRRSYIRVHRVADTAGAGASAAVEHTLTEESRRPCKGQAAKTIIILSTGAMGAEADLHLGGSGPCLAGTIDDLVDNQYWYYVNE
ncbi:hypothetical protein C8Q76DRAFT_689263 [Earliella scabrosa]|nr:hypothetical protein C8Q76DRAFT_689263 [Earliella scabrosa]